MLEDLTPQGFLSIAEHNHLRAEAMRLFEQCLNEGKELHLVEFVQAKLLQDPPQLGLMRQLVDDLQQRLLSLREYHFDVRDRVVRTFLENYNIDLTPLTPPDALSEYHNLTSDQVIALLNVSGVTLEPTDRALLLKMIDASLQIAEQLSNDILLTLRIQQMVLDWLAAYNATIARDHWNQYNDVDKRTIFH